MRARMALHYNKIKTILREVDLKNKPLELMQLSPKATVPVLDLHNGSVINESLDIMYWSLSQNSSTEWYPAEYQTDINSLIQHNDNIFKPYLDHYKYADRYPQHSQEYYRTQGESFLQKLENLLSKNNYLIHNKVSLADVALFPFIRQFAYVDIKWFENTPYPQIHKWLNNWLGSELFQSCMLKSPTWRPGIPDFYL